jgi:hypothetical protein
VCRQTTDPGRPPLTMTKATEVEKYLGTYALLPGGCPELDRQWQHIVVVPCYDESPEFIEDFCQCHGSTSILLLLVINRPEGSASTVNQRLRDGLTGWPHEAIQPGYALHRAGEHLSILSVDLEYLEGETPRDQGVGRARRVGCDLALALINTGTITSRWIVSGDADCHWPGGFFQECWPHDASAVSLPFTHHLFENDSTSAATLLYELKLHHYVLHLAALGSPYGFHALGSSFAVRANAYAAVRGVPLRSAGEDFYLLNKLAKVGLIHRATGTGVTITARQSSRVPFGTGPAVRRLLQAENMLSEPLFYDAKSFSTVGRLLEKFNRWVNHPETNTEAELGEALGSDIASSVTPLLKQWHYEKAIAHIHNAARTEALRQQHTHVWLDGFKLLKLIHLLRDNHYPNISFIDSVNQPAQWPIALRGAAPEQVRQSIYKHLNWEF